MRNTLSVPRSTPAPLPGSRQGADAAGQTDAARKKLVRTGLLLTLAGALGLGTLSLLAPGCERQQPAADAGSADDTAETARAPDQTASRGTNHGTDQPDPASVPVDYIVRGRIAQLPDPARPLAELQIHHEAIPDFRGRDGEIMQRADGTTGMQEMIMPFPLGTGVTLEGVSIGDEVRVHFTVQWTASPPYFVTKLEKLPAGTRLEFDPEPGSSLADPAGDGHAPEAPGA